MVTGFSDGIAAGAETLLFEFYNGDAVFSLSVDAGAEAAHTGVTLEAVSYTHLDVYKRQFNGSIAVQDGIDTPGRGYGSGNPDKDHRDHHHRHEDLHHIFHHCHDVAIGRCV